MKPTHSRWLPAILWAVFIFVASSISDPLSLLPGAIGPNIETAKFLGILLDDLVYAVSHILIYTVLAYLLSRALLQEQLYLSEFAFIFSIAMLYALSDEIHQHFVPGRGFQLLDLLMDAIGAILGIVIFQIFHKAKQPIRE